MIECFWWNGMEKKIRNKEKEIKKKKKKKLIDYDLRSCIQ